MKRSRILVVDDEREILVSCHRILEDLGYEVVSADRAADGLRLLETQYFDLMFFDLRMPEIDGLELLERARAIDSEAMMIIFTGHATLQTAVEAVKKGAFNYIAKPFTAEDLALAAERALEHRALVRENDALREQVSNHYSFENIVGISPNMQYVFKLVRKIAPTDANVLITGESGTGKELIARAVHAAGNRNRGPFVPVDCAALPEHLLESELFGYEKGAFTGADRSKRGLLEQAHTGTLFLDEIGELPLLLQVKLLRVLQEREFRRLGGERLLTVDIRVVASTNRIIRDEVRQGRFREDLLFRLNVVNLELPPLRERGDDIVALARHFLVKFRKAYQKEIRSISPEALEMLKRHPWPGNVRELENVIARAVALCETERLEVSDFPAHFRSPETTLRHSDGEPLVEMRRNWQARIERPYLIELLEKAGGNVSAAARVAHLSRKSFYRLLKKFDIRQGESL